MSALKVENLTCLQVKPKKESIVLIIYIYIHRLRHAWYGIQGKLRLAFHYLKHFAIVNTNTFIKIILLICRINYTDKYN